MGFVIASIKSKPKKFPISTSVESEIKEKVINFCKNNRISPSVFLRGLIESFIYKTDEVVFKKEE